MFLSFSVANYRSIKDRQTLSLLPVSRVQHLPDNVISNGNYEALRSIALYGRNASGKSNTLMAMRAICAFVSESNIFQLDEYIPYYEPYRLAEGNERQPVAFEIEFVAHSIRYTYEVHFMNNEVVQETLKMFPKLQPQLLFSRDTTGCEWGNSVRGNKKSVQEQLLPNQLLLSKGANSNIELLQAPYRYIVSHILADLYPRIPSGIGDTQVIAEVAKSIATDENSALRNFLNQALIIADTDIYGIVAEKTPLEAIDVFSGKERNEAREPYNYRLKTIHRIRNEDGTESEVLFDFFDESARTQAFVVAACKIYSFFLSGATLIIDELSLHLHPELSHFLLRLFNDPTVNLRGAQLIFTTHDVTLMDEKVIRRDQIWFVEKEDNSSILYSLADIKGVRKEIDIQQWYMNGRFGAVPKIGKFDTTLIKNAYEETAEK